MTLARVAHRRHAAFVGSEFSGVGLCGPMRFERMMLNAPNPAPRPIIIRIGTQPCMRDPRRTPRLVNVFSSPA